MKLQYLGTAAAEGIPGIFCECEVCKQAIKLGGREIRTRSQAIIDDKILIDFSADTYHHVLTQGLRLQKIHTLLITHAHEDHFYPADLEMANQNLAYFDEEPYQLTVYGSACIGAHLQEKVLRVMNKEQPRIVYQEIHSLEPFEAEGYTVLPFRARHDPNAGPLCYIISHEGKTLLYGHDTGYYFDEVWAYMKEHHIHLDYASLDCTEACNHINYDAHGSLERDITIRDRLIDEGIADEKTVFCLNHFSHNGKNVLYKDFSEIAAKEGFIVSYDGMSVEI